jgi:hypothetical protein
MQVTTLQGKEITVIGMVSDGQTVEFTAQLTEEIRKEAQDGKLRSLIIDGEQWAGVLIRFVGERKAHFKALFKQQRRKPAEDLSKMRLEDLQMKIAAFETLLEDAREFNRQKELELQRALQTIRELREATSGINQTLEEIAQWLKEVEYDRIGDEGETLTEQGWYFVDEFRERFMKGRKSNERCP